MIEDHIASSFQQLGDDGRMFNTLTQMLFYAPDAEATRLAIEFAPGYAYRVFQMDELKEVLSIWSNAGVDRCESYIKVWAMERYLKDYPYEREAVEKALYDEVHGEDGL